MPLKLFLQTLCLMLPYTLCFHTQPLLTFLFQLGSFQLPSSTCQILNSSQGFPQWCYPTRSLAKLHGALYSLHYSQILLTVLLKNLSSWLHHIPLVGHQLVSSDSFISVPLTESGPRYSKSQLGMQCGRRSKRSGLDYRISILCAGASAGVRQERLPVCTCSESLLKVCALGPSPALPKS